MSQKLLANWHSAAKTEAWPQRTLRWLMASVISHLVDLKWPAAAIAFPGVADFSGDSQTDID